MTKALEGKTTIITGGNSGMGLATAVRFAKEGANVVITGRRQSEIDIALKEINSPNAIGVQGDVSKLADLDKLYATVKAKFGKVDILFANAGVAQFAPIEQVTEQAFDTHFNINVKGLYFTVQKALPLMQNGGSIILNASVVASKGFPGTSIYSGTKAAVRNFAHTLTAELASKKIRVNVISPGPIDTPIFEKTDMPAEQQKETKEGFASMVPMGRMGMPQEIAAAALFLASNESSYISGIELTVDGGMAQV